MQYNSTPYNSAPHHISTPCNILVYHATVHHTICSTPCNIIVYHTTEHQIIHSTPYHTTMQHIIHSTLNHILIHLQQYTTIYNSTPQTLKHNIHSRPHTTYYTHHTTLHHTIQHHIISYNATSYHTIPQDIY